jgi:RNA polymerase sigma factor (sigma-70 family)
VAATLYRLCGRGRPRASFLLSLSSFGGGGYYELVNELTDSQLLRAYVDDRSETAFAELVRRHVDFVYSTAKRLVQDGHLAQDVAQGVFVALARNAAPLRERPALAGWLHRTAQNIAAQTVRTDVRRRRREQEAVAMNELLGHAADPAWESIAPQLDAALNELSEADREVMLLRYFEKKTAREIAQIMGGSEESAHKRAQRAMERLREAFARRGVAAGAGGLAAVISAEAVQAAPAGLATAFTSAALTGAAGPTITNAILASTKTIAMTTLQKLVVAATVSVLAGAGIYEASQAAHLRQQNLVLEQQQAQLLRERAAAPDPAAATPTSSAPTPTNDNNELLKLRGEVAVLRQQADAANEKARAAEQKLAAEISTKEQFAAHQREVINAAKQVGLAMRIWSGDNNGLYPTDIMDMTNELSLHPDAAGRIDYKVGNVELYAFEFPNVNGLVEDHPNAVAGRERLAHQAPDGTWQRIYLFADGSVQTATTVNGDFSVWEKANTYSPPADPGQ